MHVANVSKIAGISAVHALFIYFAGRKRNLFTTTFKIMLWIFVAAIAAKAGAIEYTGQNFLQETVFQAGTDAYSVELVSTVYNPFAPDGPNSPIASSSGSSIEPLATSAPTERVSSVSAGPILVTPTSLIIASTAPTTTATTSETTSAITTENAPTIPTTTSVPTTEIPKPSPTITSIVQPATIAPTLTSSGVVVVYETDWVTVTSCATRTSTLPTLATGRGPNTFGFEGWNTTFVMSDSAPPHPQLPATFITSVAMPTLVTPTLVTPTLVTPSEITAVTTTTTTTTSPIVSTAIATEFGLGVVVISSTTYLLVPVPTQLLSCSQNLPSQNNPQSLSGPDPLPTSVFGFDVISTSVSLAERSLPTVTNVIGVAHFDNSTTIANGAGYPGPSYLAVALILTFGIFLFS